MLKNACTDGRPLELYFIYGWCLQSLLYSKTPRALDGDFAKAREISNENFSVVRGHVVEKSPGNDMESYISHAIEKWMLLFSEPFL